MGLFFDQTATLNDSAFFLVLIGSSPLEVVVVSMAVHTGSSSTRGPEPAASMRRLLILSRRRQAQFGGGRTRALDNTWASVLFTISKRLDPFRTRIQLLRRWGPIVHIALPRCAWSWRGLGERF